MTYLPYYHLEDHIESVGATFRESGDLSVEDFFCIIIWKSNRPKRTIAHGLMNKYNCSLTEAVKTLTKSIFECNDPKVRLFILIEVDGISLAMASGFLTILYPEEYTVYDYRVVEVLKKYTGKDYKDAKSTTVKSRIWERYSSFVEDVRNWETDEATSLRDKDRVLWGRSFIEQLRSDIQHSFRTNTG